LWYFQQNYQLRIAQHYGAKIGAKNGALHQAWKALGGLHPS
jgi:hypothetical protein